MVRLESLPLPDPDAKALKEWIRQPAFKIFVNWLANESARLTAEAGNSLVNPDMSGDARVLTAEELADQARTYLQVRQIMIGLVSPEPIGYTKLTPQPLTSVVDE